MMIEAPALALKGAIDPTDMGVGARPFGMGRAFSALSDDCNSIFLNPAGLGFTKNFQMTTMYANLLGEINYSLLGFSHAWSSEAIGIGYVQADVGKGSVITGRDLSTGRIIPVGDPIGYVASALLLSYGGSLRRFTDMDYLKDVYIGATFKIFNQEISGGSIEAAATGTEMDIGAIYVPVPWLKFGAFGQNVLPEDFGGVVRWTSGTEEGVYSNTKAGVSVKLIGEDAPWQYSDQELFASYDIEMSHRPGLHHLGLEWWPINYFACRLGLDQDAVDNGGEIGVDNNLTAGIGLYYNGYEFDYAYHQFSSLPENSTHFFSISLGIFKEKAEAAPPPPPAAKSRYILSVYPSLEAIIYSGILNVTGEVEPEVEMVRVGERSVPVSNGKFAIAIAAGKAGKNSFIIEALNPVGRKLDEAKLKVLRLPSFDDVSDNYWAGAPIKTMAALGLVQGYPDGNFKPDGDITRAELTTMLVRAVMKVLPLVTEPRLFKDVTYKHWAAPFIKEGVERGFVTGYPDKSFKPGSNINRAEGTVLMARFAGISEPDLIYEKPFADLPINHWAIKMISGAKDAGLLEYLRGKDFGAKKNLTRAEAVEMLSKTKFAQEKTADLLDFGSGY